MTMTDEMTAPGAADDAAPGPGFLMPSEPRSGVPLSRRDKELLRIEVQREKDAADREAQQARFEQAQRQRRERSEQRREERRDRAEQKREDRTDRREARGETIRAVSGWIEEHQTDLLVAPLIAMPAWLGWVAMSTFGEEFWGAPGNALPVISECGMWAFSFAIARERRKNPAAIVWPLYLAMFCFAGLCAGLNAAHGLLGPLPGSIPKGPLPAAVYAAVSVSGLFAHQILALRGRLKVTTRKKVTAPKVTRVVTIWPWQKVTSAAAGGDRRSDREVTGGANGSARAGANSGGGSGNEAPRESGGSGNVTPPNPDELARGDKTALARQLWDLKIAAGEIPSAGDLNEAAGNARSATLGKNLFKKWRGELDGKNFPASGSAGVSGKDGSR